MSSRSLAAALLLSALSFGCGSAVAAGSSFAAKVISVLDGDTVMALMPDRTQSRIRLANIDAPETGHGSCRPAQPWSTRSTQVLAGLVKGQTARFVCHGDDRYGRLICDIFAGDSAASVNKAMVEMGAAWANTAYLRDRSIADAQRRAQSSRLGLWGDNSVQQKSPPWEWRKTRWNQPGCKVLGSLRG